MRSGFLPIFAVLSFCQIGRPELARAYHLSEHEQITRRAVAELNDCVPGLVPDQDAAVLVAADLAEDLNLFRKWFRYSHYFNPVKPIHLLRRDSLERVEGLEGRALEELGAILHHLQDMSVPAHVVPIEHGARDEFELLALAAAEWPAADSASADQDCEAIREGARGSFADLLKETALTTWKKIGEDPWSRVWLPSPDSSMGRYGKIPFADRTFKAGQLRLALDASKKALYRRYVLMNP
ncbi:MAG: hypothetical protein ACXVBW_08580 [Bdellovibrionota bacterium]